MLADNRCKRRRQLGVGAVANYEQCRPTTAASGVASCRAGVVRDYLRCRSTTLATGAAFC